MNSPLARRFVACTVALLLASFGVRALRANEPAGEPVGVSPGDGRGAAATGPCPSFSWAPASSAIGYELVVYRLAPGGIDPVPVLSQSIHGAALAWTPSLDRCLPRAHRYAWAVRAVIEGGGTSDWSEPLLFEVPDRSPADRDLAWAVEVIRRHTDADAVAGRSLPDLLPAGARVETPTASPGVDSRRSTASAIDSAAGGITRRVSRVIAAGDPAAHLKVAGEVRTIDADDPGGPARLWGRGRVDAEVYGVGEGAESPCTNGSIQFGLSTIVVDWGSAADACPAGTWVCKADEVAACDTTRPDGFGLVDAFACDGQAIELAANNHRGWVADRAGGWSGALRVEQGGSSSAHVCSSYPVWCCWK